MAGSQASTGISDLERQAVLALRPFFSKDPIVFDVGSNKGGWTDILIENVSEMHLFEANDRLLTYTMVKYDYLTNIIYVDKAVTSKPNQNIVFHYFTNENNGLSSIYNNPKWDYLPKKQKVVQTITLDYYWRINRMIDFVKIDVEGAEMEVLLGAAGLLQNKLIRYIQVEYSEHYDLSGTKFTDLIDFVTSFGYSVYSFDGEFNQVTHENFSENYRLENFWIMLSITQNWNAEFKKNTKDIKVLMACEVGCFEGLTTNYICDNILKEGGRIICVDPLTDEYLPDHPDNGMFVGQYERFMRNTKGRPVELVRKKSLDAIEQLKDYRFGLIYIDGDHTEDGVFNDAVAYWNLLLDSPRGAGGYMLFDDYGQSNETKVGIDRFLETQRGNYHVLIKGYQVLLQRLW